LKTVLSTGDTVTGVVEGVEAKDIRHISNLLSNTSWRRKRSERESILDICEERSDEFNGFIFVAWRGEELSDKLKFLFLNIDGNMLSSLCSSS